MPSVAIKSNERHSVVKTLVIGQCQLGDRRFLYGFKDILEQMYRIYVIDLIY